MEWKRKRERARERVREKEEKEIREVHKQVSVNTKT